MLAAALVAGGCSNGAERASPPEPSIRASVSPASTPSPSPTFAPPAPSGRISRGAAGLADDLVDTEAALFIAIDVWRSDGRRAKAATLALRQQKIYRLLLRRPGLVKGVIARLDPQKARRVERRVKVAAAVRAGVQPVQPPLRLKTRRPAPAETLRRFFDTAGDRFGVDPRVLAAINFVETRFGRILGPSSAGALGPMQFLPSTWEQYGNGGDILDPRDSIFAAARMLAANGARSNIRGALRAYNNSDAYVDAVLLYAREMRRDERHFFSYYLWQVFVITPGGDVQLTGPGCCNH